MEQRKNPFVLIYLLIFFIVFILYLIYIGDKEFWSYGTAPALVLFVAVPITILGLFIVIKKREGKVFGLFGLILGFIMLFWVTKALLNFYQDIPYYKNHDYKMAAGAGKIKQHCSKGGCSETIYINNLELKNLYVPIYNLNYKGHLKIYYLPHTKLIMKRSTGTVLLKRN